VNKHTNEIQSIDVLYAVNAKKEPAGSSKSPEVSTPPTGSTISISNLLDYVNNNFPDILPESVLKHYGYSSRPEGNIGESALFSRDVDYAEGVLLFVIKSVAENKFYIHNMNLQNKNETVSLNTKDKKSRGYISYDLSRTDNIANNVSNVNNAICCFVYSE